MLKKKLLEGHLVKLDDFNQKIEITVKLMNIKHSELFK